MSTALGLGAAALLGLPACAAAGELIVASHGQSAYQIMVPNHRSAAIEYAAAELQRLLREVSGADVPVVRERRNPRGPAFLLGPSKRAEKTGLVEEARKLGPDGVLLKTVGKDIVLLGGGDRGQLYSVYVLCERYLGCRFLAWDCTVTPHREVLGLPRVDYTHDPQFIYREELYYDASRWDFAARLRLNGSNIYQCQGVPMAESGERIPGFLISPFVHTTTGIVSADKYFAEHPEYFGLVNGQRKVGGVGSQLCLTNPDVLRITTDFVLKWLADHPEVTSVDISQNDAYPGSSGACECPACTAIVQEEGSQSGPVLRFVNAVATEVAKRFPGKYVDTLAYDYTITRCKITKPRDNVIIRLCQYACYFHGLTEDPLGTTFRAAIDDWRPVSKHLFIWHYGVNFWHYLAPNPNLTAMANDIKYYAAHGVDGVMVQGDLQGPGSEIADFRQYLIAQLLWDPTLDPMVLRTQFCEGYYGPAKGEALEFLALLDELGATTQRHAPTNGWNPPDVATPEFVKAAMEVLERALAKAGDPVYANRIEKLMVPLWYVQLVWPDQYGVSKEEGRAVLARFEKTIRANGITTISEGPPNAEGFIAQMHGVYDAAGGGG